MERRLVTVRESGNGYVCTLEVYNGDEIVAKKEMLVVGSDMGCLGEAVVELFKHRIRDRKKKKAEVSFLLGCYHGKVASECSICSPRASRGIMDPPEEGKI